MSFDVPHVDIDSYVLGESLDGPPKLQRWHRLVEHAATRNIRSVSSMGLLAGAVASGWGTPVIWCTRADAHLVADLALIAATYGHGLVWSVPEAAIRPGLSHALGLGVVCAVATSRAANELPVGELRDELRTRTAAIAQHTGYRPTAWDARDADALVVSEATRAGLSVAIHPTPLPGSLSPADACRWLERDPFLRARSLFERIRTR